MATFTVTKRKNKNSTSWQYDVKHPSFKSGKKRKSGFKTKAEATNAAQQLIRDLEDGNFLEDNKTFSDYYNEWLIIKNKRELASQQYYWYERSLRLFNEYFGDRFLIKNLKRSEYQKFLNEFGQNRATETVRKVHGCLSRCIKDAVYDGYLKKDPTYQVDIRGTKKSKREEKKYITIKDYLALMEYFKSRDEESYIFLYILSITGARFSDVINMLHIDLNEKDELIHLRGTKTSNADRFVEVPKKDIKLIKSKLSKLPKRTNGKLFKLSHNAVLKSFRYAKKQIGLNDDDITPYALRHTHTSYLLSKGIPIEYISKRLGHYNISITLEVYSHLLDEQKKEQGQRVKELFS
ncbi:site-specific integrase [Staphylococcus muscae]|uniref:Putative integrase n=1 Tax=Staphylococcus muscae TaxID=1294 RepID=A0A240C040_9STAP|nr:site-specific integrase [Staphylococcus muscae]AVQ34367.1 site-specific integrase [Staphylococcus muscae]PNZ03166.1 site-specific integrase [Staphylococcus muscae]GGA83805.1 site-specific integrase [Staphylococcus muscae]SNW00468.1 putative integrase [Staphylococcus muscae]